MKTYIRKIEHFVAELSPKAIVFSFAVFLAVTVIPASVLAWGPARQTFTIQQPATYVTFNSITNNPAHGDERNFMQVRDKDATNAGYTDTMPLTGGKEYVVYIYYHNNASSSFNASGVGIAHGAFAKAQIPALVKNGAATKAAAYVGASNANPASVYDDVTFQNTTGGDIALRYVPGSTTIHSFGPVNGKTMPDSILTDSGVKLGYSALDGNLPGCNDYAGYITFRVKADQPNFTFKKDVRVSGTKDWADTTTAAAGTKVDYQLTYQNTGSTQQTNVVLKDQLPAGVTYVPGSAKLKNGSFPNGKAIGDEIAQGGVNIGTYNPGAAAYLLFSATVNGTTCQTLTNTAAVETNNGSQTDTASVKFPGNACVAALPTTGPVEVIASFIGLGAMTVGIVYYLKSRRDLEHTLHEAQIHATTITHDNE